ncbi:MAG: hypothetical protein MUE69_23315, partial [Myxococcota bacterium]|nr:hypothetical protein [Myxococcota bacterium]
MRHELQSCVVEAVRAGAPRIVTAFGALLVAAPTVTKRESLVGRPVGREIISVRFIEISKYAGGTSAAENTRGSAHYLTDFVPQHFLGAGHPPRGAQRRVAFEASTPIVPVLETLIGRRRGWRLLSEADVIVGVDETWAHHAVRTHDLGRGRGAGGRGAVTAHARDQAVGSHEDLPTAEDLAGREDVARDEHPGVASGDGATSLGRSGERVTGAGGDRRGRKELTRYDASVRGHEAIGKAAVRDLPVWQHEPVREATVVLGGTVVVAAAEGEEERARKKKRQGGAPNPKRVHETSRRRTTA